MTEERTSSDEKRPTRQLRAIVLWGVVVAFAIAVLVWALLPPYGNYTPRAKVAEVVLWIHHEGRAQVDEFYRQRKRLPRDAVEANLSLQSGGKVRKLTYDGTKGELRALIQNIPELNGRTLVMKAQPRGEQLGWTCFGEGIPEEFLPRVCRR